MAFLPLSIALLALSGPNTAVIAQDPFLFINEPREWGRGPVPPPLLVEYRQRILISGQAHHPAGIRGILVAGVPAELQPADTSGQTFDFEFVYTAQFTSEESSKTILIEVHPVGLDEPFEAAFDLDFKDEGLLPQFVAGDWTTAVDSMILLVGIPDTVPIFLTDPPFPLVPGYFIAWSSSNPEVVNVTPEGVVNPVGIGPAEVSASGPKHVWSIPVRVFSESTKVAFTPLDSVIDLVVGEPLSIRADLSIDGGARPLAGRIPKVEVRDNVILRPEAPGDFRAAREGEVAVRASLGRYEAEWLVRVHAPGIRVADQYGALLLGTPTTLSAQRTGLDGAVLGPASNARWRAQNRGPALIQGDAIEGTDVGRVLVQASLQASLGDVTDTASFFVLGDLLISGKTRSGEEVISTASLSRGRTYAIGGDSIHGTEPSLSPDGRTIVFSAVREKRQPRLYLMDPDGTNLRSLVPEKESSFLSFGSSYVERTPRWTSDGERIVFVSNRDSGNNFEIYSITPEGDGLHRITQNGAQDLAVATAPDGPRIAFQRMAGSANSDLVIANLDGSGERVYRIHSQLPGLLVSEGKPQLLPGGQNLVYARGAPGLKPEAGETMTLFDVVMGSNIRDLVAPERDHELIFAVSPDGQRIAYHQRATFGEKNSLITVIDLDGSFSDAITVEGFRDILSISWGAYPQTVR